MTPSDQQLLRELLKEQTRGAPSVWRTGYYLEPGSREMSPLATQVMRNENERRSRRQSLAQSGKKRR